MNNFLQGWAESAYTSLGFFWMAMWAFILGYIISSLIQVFITEQRMQEVMGNSDGKSVLLGTFFGFISSSCSFSALATTKSLFQKGSSFIAAIAFLLASTNLVIELGIIISIFLGWQFVVGEYLGGLLLILVSWILIRLIKPTKLIDQARKKLGASSEEDHPEEQDRRLSKRLSSERNWVKVGKQYAMEWKMVWKDVTVGFTIAGIAATFIPDTFFETLFINTGNGQQSFQFLTLVEHVIIGPIAAFLTFIGSMGNIPLAALLFGKGVSFAGVMAFIFSDLIVFPVMRINAKYYGWKMSFFISFLLFTALIVASLVLHYSFDFFDLIPKDAANQLSQKEHFAIDYTFYLNIAFLTLTSMLVYMGFFRKNKIKQHKEMAPKSSLLENILRWLALACYLWLGIGLFLHFWL